MSQRTARLEVDQLGERIVPSVTTVRTPPVITARVAPVRQVTLTTLSGSGQGSFNLAPTRFGAGPAYSLRATGTIAGMGGVNLTGTLYAPALNASGPVSGLLLLRTAQGTVTVSLTAPSQSGHSPLPTSFQYQVIASTGLFAGSSAHGTMHLALALGHSSVGLGSVTFSF